jgi:hypothetical protein
MCFLVHNKVRACAKGFSILIAVIRFLSSVSSHMSLKRCFWLKTFPHWLHSEGFSPVWVLTCLLKVEESLNIFLHPLHTYSFSPMWLFLCKIRLEILLKVFPHCLQSYCFSPGMSLLFFLMGWMTIEGFLIFCTSSVIFHHKKIVIRRKHITMFALCTMFAACVLFFFFCGTGAWTQGLLLEPLHQPFFVMGIFKTGSCKLFAQAGFELWSSWSLPPEQLGLQVWATSTKQVYSFLCY